MAMKSAIVFLALLVIAMAPSGHGGGTPQSTPQAVERWFRRLPFAKQKITRLHFFIHDVMTGDHPTTIPVAQANMTANSPTKFGLVYVMDSPLTQGPEMDSKLVGRCQGLFTFASQEEIGLLLTLNFVFTDGPYSGSTLSILGPKKNADRYREYPIIGGTGVFRLAEGVAVDGTYQGPVAPGAKAPTECQVIVSHYDAPEFVEQI